MGSIVRESSSFRDDSGFLFYEGGCLYRVISKKYSADFDAFHKSGLYEKLVSEELLIPYEIIEKGSSLEQVDCYKVIKPTIIPFISYPYEWTFSQLKSAALITLKIQQISMEYGFCLKDASAFNVQFIGTKPVFIDTSSFERYRTNNPWVAYKQFCEHFLAPLLLDIYGFEEIQKLLSVYIDGIPLKLAADTLPFKSRFNSLSLFHIHLHSKSEQRNADVVSVDKKKLKLKPERLKAIINHLENGISKLKYGSKTNWTNYYNSCSYAEEAISEKKEIVDSCLKSIKSERIFDAGCNEGIFSEIAANYCNQVISTDNDYAVIDNFYKKTSSEKILPLVVDLTNPTSGVGWGNAERKSFQERLGKNCTTLALALIHHLTIGNNIPLEMIAKYFKEFSNYLIIEFVPIDDPQTQRLLVTKKNIFDNYNLCNFKEIFSKEFEFLVDKKVQGTERTIFFMKRKDEIF